MSQQFARPSKADDAADQNGRDRAATAYRSNGCNFRLSRKLRADQQGMVFCPFQKSFAEKLPKRKTKQFNNYKMSCRSRSNIGLPGGTIMQIPIMRIRPASTKVSRSLPAVVAAMLLLSAGGASGQAPPVEYAVKFVCGRAVQDRTTPVATGFYYTDINVHNPNTAGIEFKKKFAVALPNQKPGPVSQFFSAALKPDEAFSVDCFEILKRLGLSPSNFVTGFAVFQTTRELDVVAVYTAAASPSSSVVTMHMERVPKRP